jgi:hypothetical protein
MSGENIDNEEVGSSRLGFGERPQVIPGLEILDTQDMPSLSRSRSLHIL